MQSKSWQEVDVIEVYPGVVRQTISGAASTVTRYTYAPGSTFPMHRHPEEQITIVHQGTIEFEVGDQRIVLGPGDLAVIPADTPHGARVIGEETVISDNYLPTGSRAGLLQAEEDLA